MEDLTTYVANISFHSFNSLKTIKLSIMQQLDTKNVSHCIIEFTDVVEQQMQTEVCRVLYECISFDLKSGYKTMTVSPTRSQNPAVAWPAEYENYRILIKTYNIAKSYLIKINQTECDSLVSQSILIGNIDWCQSFTDLLKTLYTHACFNTHDDQYAELSDFSKYIISIINILITKYIDKYTRTLQELLDAPFNMRVKHMILVHNISICIIYLLMFKTHQ